MLGERGWNRVLISITLRAHKGLLFDSLRRLKNYLLQPGSPDA